jgi:hypothetical protein
MWACRSDMRFSLVNSFVMCRKSQVAGYGLFLTLLCASFSQAQTPQTEEEWRQAHEQVSKEYGETKGNLWGGIVLAGIGAPLTIYGSAHGKECIQGGFALGSGIICDRYADRADWKIMGPGLGALGGGVFVILHSAQTRQRKAERLRDLDRIRQQHGWTVTLNSTSVQLAYRW